MPTETKWTLPTPDGKTIHGLKNTAQNSPAGQGAKSAVFLAHGLSSSIYDYNMKRAADYFAESGYDVFRIGFYTGNENSRKMEECTLQTHADDFNIVMKAYASDYAKNFVIGHSYGGPTIMLANPENVTAASLWDPSYNVKQMNKDFASFYGKCGNYLTISWGITYLLNPAMEEHANTLDEPACINLSKAFAAPIQVVFAGDGYYVKQPLNYHSHGNPKNTSVTIPGTQHCFYEGTTCDDLLAKTHSWFKQFA